MCQDTLHSSWVQCNLEDDTFIHSHELCLTWIVQNRCSVQQESSKRITVGILLISLSM